METLEKWIAEHERDLLREYTDYLQSMIEAESVKHIEEWDAWTAEEHKVQKEHERIWRKQRECDHAVVKHGKCAFCKISYPLA